jgi:uncharacterized protein (TIGR03437 family)
MRKVLGLLLALTGGLFAQSSETIVFRAVLSPANEVPAIAINASGMGTILLHVVRDASGKVVSASTDFNTNYQFPGEVTITGMHIHKGVAGENGSVTINSNISAAAPVADPTGKGILLRQGFTGPADAAGLDTVNGMLANPAGFYLNVHTTVNPGGVIRGQLQRAESVVLMGLMSAKNEIPASPDVTATGNASVIAIATRDSSGNLTSAVVTLDVNYTGFAAGTIFSGFHIHQGGSTVNGPVTINSGINGTANSVTANVAGGNLHYDVEVAPTNAAAVETLNTLFSNPEGTYINLHTTVYPGGVIRAQLRRTDRMRFPVSMLTSNENPPITGLDASGQASVTVHTIRGTDGAVTAGTVIFDVNPRFPGATTFTGLHIHDGKAADNGPVTINTGLSGGAPFVTDSGSANIYRVVNVSTAAGLATLNSLVANPENQYVNLHTTVNPGGVVRSQLMPVNTAMPTVSAVISAISDSTRKTVAPGGLMTIFGTNLIKVPAEVMSSSTGGTLPSSYNGTQVTIGGKNAALLLTTAGYLVVQVPTDLAAGTPDLVVTNSNGASTSSKVTVATVAPGIFFDANGGILVKNSDFTLIGAGNAAKAGDIVVIYSTGLGAIAGLPSGQAAPIPNGTSGLFRTATASVTVGGKDAQVIYSLASPGFVGLYQTAIVIPAGAGTGKVPVTLKIGDSTSNTVTVLLQ